MEVYRPADKKQELDGKGTIPLYEIDAKNAVNQKRVLHEVDGKSAIGVYEMDGSNLSPSGQASDRDLLSSNHL